ncbi:tachykinin-like peptides receptor 99D [Parasteatoda tepidariorum]|uniref:tachykinin-like peptides receptor 99D n=1 Tax=Parasteatoda tepidariorum TaxID=114398 RepID=UPI00077FE3EF|nr:tachykinin-like peptides receptor 99D [Parasteatoda tepidariorum]
MEVLAEYNMTNETDEDGGNIFILPWWQQLVWSIVFGVMIFVATGGNAIVMWIVLAHKRMRSVTNYFLVNLSLADMMVSTLNVIFNFVYMLDGDWPFGEAYCKISNFIAIVSVAASVFTLMAISFDRYMAIMHPLKPRMSRSTTLNICLWIWVFSVLLSLPNLLYSMTIVEEFTNGEFRIICFMFWPDGPSTESDQEYVYNIVIFIVTYVLPITSMTFTYFRVGRELWGSQSIGECTQKQVESINSKRKIVKMMIVVVVIFAVCWLPYHIYFLVAHHVPQITSATYVQPIYLSIYWLAMSNACYNPFIYCWMNSRFRQGFKSVFRCCKWKEEKINPLEQRKFTAVRQNTTNGVIALQTVTESLSGSNPHLYNKSVRVERLSIL